MKEKIKKASTTSRGRVPTIKAPAFAKKPLTRPAPPRINAKRTLVPAPDRSNLAANRVTKERKRPELPDTR